MDAASYLSSIVDVAIGIAGFAGIVAAIRQRNLASWPAEQLFLLQILFVASAAAVFFGLLPSVLAETGLSESSVWKIGSAALLVWFVGAITFRVRQSKAAGVAFPIPKLVVVWAVAACILQIYNLITAGIAWPYMVGVSTLIINGFSVFLILVLKPTGEDEEST